MDSFTPGHTPRLSTRPDRPSAGDGAVAALWPPTPPGLVAIPPIAAPFAPGGPPSRQPDYAGMAAVLHQRCVADRATGPGFDHAFRAQPEVPRVPFDPSLPSLRLLSDDTCAAQDRADEPSPLPYVFEDLTNNRGRHMTAH